MQKRPFFKDRISQLESRFQKASGDRKLLQQLGHELEHRRTPRAMKLAGLVAKALRHESTKNSLGTWREAKSQAETSCAKISRPKISESKISRPKVSMPPSIKEPPRIENPGALHGATASSTLPPVKSTTVEEACRVLDAWLALEVLSPQTLDLASGDGRRVAELSKQRIPWLGRGEKSRPKKKLFYQVVLGAIDMERAGKALLEVYTDKRIDRPESRGYAALGVLVVDQKGIPHEEDGLAISSFSWGLPLALKKELEKLSEWPQHEQRLQRRLESTLRPRDDEGEPIPLEYTHLEHAFSSLVDELGLDPALLVGPSFAIRSYQWVAIKTPPEPLILNSFFVGDLIRARKAVQEERAGSVLRRYLRLDKPTRQADLLESSIDLESLCAPQWIPPGRWPAAHSLTVLQQAAVNGASRELEHEGILGVNGPPGTGKTTLLRDIVASVVVERAEAMSAFSDPESAFKHAGQMRMGTGFCHLYRLDDDIKGHEIVVASSNNKAVENISKELPDLAAIDQSSSLRYFSTVSDATAGGQVGTTWGLIAAVLGNAANRYEFSQKVWNDDDTSLKGYLLAAAGKKPRPVEEKDPDTGKVVERTPRIVTAEDPPAGRKEALERWDVARAELRSSLASAREILETLGRGRGHALALQRLQEERSKAIQSESDLQQRSKKARETAQTIHLEWTRLKEREAALSDEVQAWRRQRPWFLHWLFRSERWQSWSRADQQIKDRLNRAKAKREEVERELRREQAATEQLELQLGSAQEAKRIIDEEIASSQSQLQALREYVGDHLADQAFWTRNHEELHVDSPWLAEAVEMARSRVFESAIRLHKAFLDAAAKPMRHNLMALFSIFRGTGLGSPERDGLIPDIWSSLFLLTPVISTTFASVERMLGKIPPQYLGWLLVDEAGQALPQAAVGALLRSRRAVMVGDPLQLQPIVSLSPDLVDSLFREIGADPDQWAPPLVSAQTLADQASRFVSIFEQDSGSVQVGLPLLVHRRCQEPMFSISNRIAYGGNMVFASGAGPSEIVDILGESRWFEVDSSGQTKWSQEEGRIAISLVENLYRAGLDSPDLFLISPFVIVAQELRRLMARTEAVRAWSHAPQQWVDERIGTVHTFQGKEAEAVIFVLGAPNPEQAGARAWAGYPPNLLNVAATRAKAALYVVGSRALWKDKGCFSTLDRRM